MIDRQQSAAIPRLAAPLQLDLLQAALPGPEWPVRQSARARRMSARVFRDGRVEIVVPPRARPAEVARFVSQHRAWIERTRQRAQRAVPPAARGSRRLPVPSIELQALAESWQLDFEATTGAARLQAMDWRSVGHAPAAGQSGRLLLRAAPDDQAGMRALLVEWLRDRLRAAALEMLPPLAASMGTDFHSLRVACQRSRWGSCSRQGTVSLNCCLLFQRPAVLRYLLVHELAHRRHMNHSARYWQHVAVHEPDWRALDRELASGWRQVPAWVLARAVAGE